MAQELTTALLVLLSAAFGACWTLWVVHTTRTGNSPIPALPKVQLFGRSQPVDDDEDDDEPQPRRKVGP
jgi:hypothetical protein